MQPIHNFYNYEHRHDDRRRNDISNDNPTYYNDDPDSYKYNTSSLRTWDDATPDAFRTALWAIYCIAGGDPDGNHRFHCSDRDAIRSTIEAAKGLREDATEYPRATS